MIVQIWASKAIAENLRGRPFLRTTGLHYLYLLRFYGCVIKKRLILRAYCFVNLDVLLSGKSGDWRDGTA